MSDFNGDCQTQVDTTQVSGHGAHARARWVDADGQHTFLARGDNEVLALGSLICGLIDHFTEKQQ